MQKGNYGDGYTAWSDTPAERMRAFDALPKAVRTALSDALLDYTAVDFHHHYKRGMPADKLLDVLRDALKRDHKKLADVGRIARQPDLKFVLTPVSRPPSPGAAIATSREERLQRGIERLTERMARRQALRSTARRELPPPLALDRAGT